MLPLRWGEGFHAVHARGFLALVVLGHFPNGDTFGRPGFHQEALELMDRGLVSAPRGSVDPLLELEDPLFNGFPGEVVPFIH